MCLAFGVAVLKILLLGTPCVVHVWYSMWTVFTYSTHMGDNGNIAIGTCHFLLCSAQIQSG